MDPSLALTELHGGITTTATLGTAEQEEQSTKQQEREDQASGCLLPTGRLTGRLDRNVDIVFSQQTKQFTIGCKVDLRPSTVVLNHLGRALIGCDQHATDLVIFHSFNKFAVANGVDLGLITTATAAKEGWCNDDNGQDQ